MNETRSNEDAHLDGLLDQLVTVEPTPAWGDVVGRARRLRRGRGRLAGAKLSRPLMLVPATLGAIVAVVLVVVFTGGRAAHSQAASQHQHIGREATISLAGYHMRLPAGYKLTSDQACPHATPAPGQPMTVLQSWKAAASASGGCLRLSSRQAPPWCPPELP
jgi:hypothetical protein